VKGSVSIPHRYGKNSILVICEPLHSKVSIPHRYGKNPHVREGVILLDEGFPFLIGTVRTGIYMDEKQTWLIPFPFLIGTVRTIFPGGGV